MGTPKKLMTFTSRIFSAFSKDSSGLIPKFAILLKRLNVFKIIIKKLILITKYHY